MHVGGDQAGQEAFHVLLSAIALDGALYSSWRSCALELRLKEVEPIAVIAIPHLLLYRSSRGSNKCPPAPYRAPLSKLTGVENAFFARETCGKARVPPDCLRLRVRPPNSPWRRPSAAAATTTKLAAGALRCRCCLRCRPSSRPATASLSRGLRSVSSASRVPPSASITAFHASRSCYSHSYKSKRTASASPPFQRMAAQSSRREYRRQSPRRASRRHRRRA